MMKGSGTKNIDDQTSHVNCSQSMLLMKDAKRSSSHLLKGSSDMQKHSQGLGLGEYPDYVLNCHSDCLSSYSEMDEDEEDEEDARRAVMRNPRRFLSHLSISSSSSGSSSSSSSGSLSSSSACSSDNDSSYSSEDDENSTLLLQSCLTPHHSLLHPHKAPTGPPQRSFVAKAMAVSSAKGGNVDSATRKPLKRKECLSSSSKSSKDLVKRQKLLADHSRPKVSSCMPASQLWRWSGNPTQVRQELLKHVLCLSYICPKPISQL